MEQDDDLPICSGESILTGGTALCQDIQVLFIIDHSGSMRTNDPIQARFAGVENTVDLLGEVYLKALGTQSRDLPEIYVSAIHFARDVDLRTGWVPINPLDREAWEGGGAGGRSAINQILIPDNIRNLRLTSLRTTNFINPFNAAVELFKTAPSMETDCSNRIVMVLTDGAPDLGRGPLAGDLLDSHFEVVKTKAAELRDTFGSRIYVSGLSDKTRLADYWRNSETHWQDIVLGATSGDLLGAVKIVDTVDENSQPVGKLAVLRDRVQTIIERTIGLQGESVVGNEKIPAYLEFLRISYFAPNANATLKVFNPDDKLIEVDSESVTLTGAGTPDQVIKILKPEPGEYRFEPSEPGGSIRLVFSYPSFDEFLPLELEKNVFQQYTDSMLSFQVKSTPKPQEGFPQRFAAHFTQPSQETVVLNLAKGNGSFQIPFFSLNSGMGEVFIDVIIKDKEGQDCLLHRSESADFEVVAVKMFANPSNPEVCTPSGMPIRFPIELRNTKTNALTTISLPKVSINWQVEAVHENGSPVKASVNETSESGVYEFSLSAEEAGRITTSVTASVSQDNYTAILYEETFEFTQLLQDRFYAFELTGVEPLADDLSIRFNEWFNRISTDPDITLLMGRTWFDWSGQQTVQVSGRFFNKVTGESIAGIQHYQVALLPAGGGEAVVASNNWQDIGDGEYALTFTPPALGAYQIRITGRDEAVACVEVDLSGSGLSVILINQYGEYLFWILFIFLIVILFILLILRPRHARQPDRETPDEQENDDQDEQKKDDLKIIEGIGPAVERLLNAAGITTFAQLAEAENRIEEIQSRLDQAGYHYMYPGSWPGQAKLAAAGDWVGLQKLKDELVRGRPV